MKWIYCELCESLVRKRFHFFMHMIALSLAIKMERVAHELQRRHK